VDVACHGRGNSGDQEEQEATVAHVDPAHLVELALGNDDPINDARALRHIAACVRCRDELRRMAHVVAVARGVEASDLPAVPPERVWQHITQQLSDAGVTASAPDAVTARRPGGAAVDEGRTRRSRGTGIRMGQRALLALKKAVRHVTSSLSARRSGRG
jgi:hypothetical protein